MKALMENIKNYFCHLNMIQNVCKENSLHIFLRLSTYIWHLYLGFAHYFDVPGIVSLFQFSTEINTTIETQVVVLKSSNNAERNLTITNDLIIPLHHSTNENSTANKHHFIGFFAFLHSHIT